MARANSSKSEESPELDVEPRVGITVAHLSLRRYQPQPARFVIGAAYDAEQARGEPGDIVVLAVDPDDLERVLALVRGVLADARATAG